MKLTVGTTSTKDYGKIWGELAISVSKSSDSDKEKGVFVEVIIRIQLEAPAATKNIKLEDTGQVFREIVQTLERLKLQLPTSIISLPPKGGYWPNEMIDGLREEIIGMGLTVN